MCKMEYYEATYQNIMKRVDSMDRDFSLDKLLYQLENDQEIDKSDAKVIAWYRKVTVTKLPRRD